MLKRKRLREKGNFSFKNYFQKLDSGDSVAIVRDLTFQSSGFPKRMQGRTGKIVDSKGFAFIVEVKDYNLKKRYSVLPIHLKKIKDTK
jgi:ribosomal protein L21E